MSKSASKYFFSLLLVAVIMLNIGCTAKNSQFDAPMKIDYLVENGITIETKSARSDDRFNYNYMQIRGLKDQEVERKINNRLKQEFEKMTDDALPPYRGIKSLHQNPGRVYAESIDMMVGANFNNMLSVLTIKSTTRTLMEGDLNDPNIPFYNQSWYCGEESALNIDLNTGDEIALADLFCDNVDYMTLINDYVNDALQKANATEEGGYAYMDEVGSLTLVEPFKGLKEEQKFVLYDSGIYLIFDYDTPQFNVGFGPSGLLLDYDKFESQLAMARRFFAADQNLYKKNSRVKRLLLKNVANDITKNSYDRVESVNVTKSLYYSSAYPKSVREEMESLYAKDSVLIGQLNERIAAKAALTEDEGENPMQDTEIDRSGFCDILVTAAVAGNYIAVEYSQFPYLSDDEMMDAVISYQTFDAKSGVKIPPERLFVEGFDYHQRIREWAKENDVTLYDEIVGIGVYHTGLQVATQREQDGKVAYAAAYVPYGELGCDNLTIFQPSESE